MGKKRTGNNQFLKRFNQKVILDLIRTNKTVSKAELSSMTGLSANAVGMITSSLIEEGYIYETGIGESKGGRRPMLLELKPHSFYSVGVDLDIDAMNIVLMDITGEVIEEKSISMPADIGVEVVVNSIETEILKILFQFSIDISKLLGVGISIPGVISSGTREVILAPNLGWENVNVKIHFNKLSKIPIYIENEAMASAICEHWIGICQKTKHFVCINIKSGIGAGIFANGKIYRGADGSAGEVGHIVVNENGPKCGCGKYGCLETLASTTHVVEMAKTLVKQGIVSSLNEVKEIDDITIETIVEAAKKGDIAAKNILLEAARYLGIAVSELVNILNPSVIVLGKEFVKYADLVIDDIKKIVHTKALNYSASKVKIIASQIGEKTSTLGAAIIPLKVLFGK